MTVQTRIDRMKDALNSAEARISDQKPLEDNREALKTLMWKLLDEFAGLVDDAGGSSLYIPDRDYLSEDVERAFHDAIEDYDDRQPRIDNRQYSTLSHGIQGLRVHGAHL